MGGEEGGGEGYNFNTNTNTKKINTRLKATQTITAPSHTAKETVKSRDRVNHSQKRE